MYLNYLLNHLYLRCRKYLMYHYLQQYPNFRLHLKYLMYRLNLMYLSYLQYLKY
jgi:hypothetical protein